MKPALFYFVWTKHEAKSPKRLKPAVLGGSRVVHGGVFVTAREHGFGVMALAAAAFLGSVWRRPARAILGVVSAKPPTIERSVHAAT